MTAFNGSGGFGGDFYAAYKHIYNPKRVAVLAYENRPFLKRLAKKDIMEGDTYNHSVFFEDPQGGSATVQTSIAQKQASSQGARFVINRGREFQTISISNEEIMASRSDTGSLLRKKKQETDRVINEMSRRIDIAVHGGGNGVLATFTTGGSVATNVITLDTPQLGVRFSFRQWIQACTAASAALTNGTAPTFIGNGAAVQIVGVSRSATVTTITLSQNLNVVWPGIATTTQYALLRNGDGLGFSLNNPFGGVSGLKSWLPVTAPVGGDNFWGYDRSVDAMRLAGLRYVGQNGEKYESTFQNASAELELQGSNPSVVLASPLDCAKYSQELGNKVRYAPSDKGQTGLGPLLVKGVSGDMELIADPQIDPGLFYMLDMETWWLGSLGSVPMLVEEDGRPALREANADAIEIRWRAWYQLICDAPGKNLVGQFAP